MIKFENDRWLAKISEDFTFANVRKVAAAIAGSLPKGKPLIVGYDSRFLSEQFAEEMAKGLLSGGFSVLLTEQDTPTPVVAWEVKDKQTAGAIMITGEGAPADISGIKLLADDNAIKKIVQSIDGRKDEVPSSSPRSIVHIERFEPRGRYLAWLENTLDLEEIKRARLKIVVDPIFGSTRGYLDRLLSAAGCRAEEIHDHRDVLFGGSAPSVNEENLAELKERVVETEADLGLAFNGDGSAFALIDRRGDYRAPDLSGDALAAALSWVAKVARREL